MSRRASDLFSGLSLFIAVVLLQPVVFYIFWPETPAFAVDLKRRNSAKLRKVTYGSRFTAQPLRDVVCA
jgi:hypothetical protein